ncbi:gag-asp-proteas multi-domain protein [Pyrenophora tritici-repentis]|nr:gag-asp-proteas multi-domain protein [Pyrenophora tritici-repentis]KAA8622496.1 gag-asp-proteas multi-domain protein [Pyrenophora tritici-repentis]KAF7449406.1 gag-asp proteas multi-domain protein [Pyrenophora tritici-repentis]KAF7450417.1 gag-asp proteas multi-domain protein [Pyrenophora tritici-repentis]
MVKGKQLVQGQQFVFKCKVATSNSYIDTEALTDSGATGNCISTLFAQRHNLPTFRLKQPLQLRLGDGNFAMAPITHGVLAPISHAEHVSEELFYSVPMTTYDFIFGTSWLEEHNPHIDWREKTMRFNSEHCYANCLHKGEQVTVRSSRHRRAAAKAKERNPTYANMDIHHVSGEAAAALASRPENGTIWLYPHDFEQLDKDDSDDADERAQASRVFASLFAMDMNALSQEDIDKFHQKLNSPAKTRDEVLDKLPEWLHDLAHRFNPDPATTDLPARRGAVDHSIDIIPGSKHPNAKMYGISKDEGLAVKAYVEDMRGRDCYKQVHPVFHPWLLHLDADQTARPSEGVIAEKHPDGEHDYYVDMVVDCRIDKRRKDTLTNKKGMLQYKVKYTNSPDWNASPAWQDYTDLWGAEEAVEDFHRLYPDKPPPHELYRDLALYLNLVAAYSLGRDDVEVVSVLDSCELALSPSHSLMAQLGPGKVAQLRTSVSKQKQGPEG